MQVIGLESKPVYGIKAKKGRVIKDSKVDSDDENVCDFKEMESLFAGSSASSMSGIFEEDGENYYQNSIMACTKIKEPE